MNPRAFLWILLLAVVGAGTAGTWVRCEGSPPSVQAPAPLLVGREPRALGFELADQGSGLRSLSVSLLRESGETALLERTLPGGWLRGGGPLVERVEIPIDAKALGLRDGSAQLRVVARDWSWRGWLRGNEARADLELRVDLRPPRISIENGLSYLQRGGSGLVVYSLDEPAAQDGVDAAGVFFAGHAFPGDPQGGRRRLAFFAIPHDAPTEPPIRVVAIDAAGNRAASGWGTRVKERSFPPVRLDLGPGFFAHKVRELAEARGLDAADPVAAFQKINREGRAADEARVREIVRDSAPEKLWSGAFEQLRNSKVTSQFAEQRSYFVEGQKVSEATHFGYDLAVTVASPITAANAGRVIFADDLGIYGNCVLIDHGLGLTTLYGHLSRVDVQAGDMVQKGQTLGLSGQTGLAGGDHLHFAILVGHTYVDPVEWWDPKWIREKVDALLAPASPPDASPQAAANAPRLP